MKLKGNHEILIAAHRGGSIHRPENTMQACEFLTAHGMAPCTGSHTGQAAFREATALGCAMFTENDPAEVMTFRDALR